MASNGDDDWNKLMAGVRAGDSESCDRFWREYGPMIERVASKNLSTALQRRVGPETVMLSACRTFFRRAQEGEFDLPDADSLWRLLCAITVNKARMKARFHNSSKRSLAAEVHPEQMPDAAAAAPTPEEEVAFAEQLELLMQQFNEEESLVLEMKLQQASQQEIADKLGCSGRTVRRMLQRIQMRMTAMWE